MVCRNSWLINEIVNCRIPFKFNAKLFTLHILMLRFLRVFLEAILMVNISIFFSQTKLQNRNCVISPICNATVIPERESTFLSINYNPDYLLASQEAACVVHMGHCYLSLPVASASIFHSSPLLFLVLIQHAVGNRRPGGNWGDKNAMCLCSPFIQGSPKRFIKIYFFNPLDTPVR